MRLTVFWEKMRGQFGEAYAASVAKDYVLADLGGATVDQALAAGKEPKNVWLAVCEAFEIPEEARCGHHGPGTRAVAAGVANGRRFPRNVCVSCPDRLDRALAEAQQVAPPVA